MHENDTELKNGLFFYLIYRSKATTPGRMVIKCKEKVTNFFKLKIISVNLTYKTNYNQLIIDC